MGDNSGMNDDTLNQDPSVDTEDEAEPEVEIQADDQPPRPASDPPPRQASEPPQRDPRRRLRELLAIPDRDRPDELWDELIELEIQLAPGNRALPAQSDGGRGQEPGRRQDRQRQEPGGRRPEQAQRQDSAPGAKPAKRFFKKPKRGPGAPPKPSNS